MSYCCVPECRTVSSTGMHVFPANKNAAKQWIRFTRTFHLEPKNLSDNRVCEIHFKETDRITDISGHKCLKKDAIPCLFLPPDLSIHTEHNYHWNYKIQKRPKPRPRRTFNKKILEAISNAIVTNDSTVYNVGNEIEIGDCNVETNQGEQAHMDPWIMLTEANKRIKTLEDKVKEKIKEKAVLARKNRINGQKLKKYKEELKSIKKDGVLMSFLEENNFKKQQVEFIMMQMKNTNKKANGRRYTYEQKSLSLAIYKQGPRCYRFLQRIFVLPSKRTLGRHSAELIFESGIDSKFFAYLKEKVKDMSPTDARCTISWDEMSLKANLSYSVTRDVIDGFIELADMRRPVFATHSLTFMVRGINTPYKQPVAFFYTHGLKSFELAALITLVTEAVLETGLNAIGSTCDQVGINVSAIHILMYHDSRTRTPDGSLLSYEISGRTIIHCYDPPHLIKVLRNNLLKKNLRHFISQRFDISSPDTVAGKKEQMASWTHVAYLYHYDSKAYHRRLKKITDEHITPKQLKMKVSLATQVFSQTYGEVMINYCKENQLPDEFMDTAQIMLFFNDVFDSINGSNHPQSYTLKGSINKQSVHLVFWKYAIEMLSKMSFIEIETGKVNNSSTILKKFESTIRGYAEITKICLKSNKTQVAVRNTNQDGLENFFGCVKDCCRNAKAPTATHFRTGYATMIINNITGSHSLSTNCEPDSSMPLLKDLHKFFLDFQKDNAACSKRDHCEPNDVLETIVFDPHPQLSKFEMNVTDNDTLSHISNFICGKVVETIACDKCRENIETYDNGASFPSQVFLKNFEILFSQINQLVPLICSEKSLKKTMIFCIEDVELGCQEHQKDVSMKLKEISINYALFSLCKNINSFLSGKNTILPCDSNRMQNLAVEFRNKNKRVGKFTDILTL